VVLIATVGLIAHHAGHAGILGLALVPVVAVLKLARIIVELAGNIVRSRRLGVLIRAARQVAVIMVGAYEMDHLARAVVVGQKLVQPHNRVVRLGLGGMMFVVGVFVILMK